MSKFKDQVIKVVSAVPYGKVVSYGQVALYVVMPRAARQVGWILNGLENTIEVPWWRVTNNKGQITIKGSEFSPDFQRKLLRSEGITVASDFTFEIEKYRWRPTQKELSGLELTREYIDKIIERYRI